MTELSPAHWRSEIERLEQLKAKAEQGLADAKTKAAQAMFDNKPDESATQGLWRERIEAATTAIGEARRRLANAEDQITAREREAALKRAQDAARTRHTAALDFDAAMAAAEQAYTRFMGANLAWRSEMMNAGQKPFSTEKLAAGEAVRGAVAAAAFTLSGALNCRPYSRDARLPLASFVNQQTPPAPSARATKKKAAA